MSVFSRESNSCPSKQAQRAVLAAFGVPTSLSTGGREKMTFLLAPIGCQNITHTRTVAKYVFIFNAAWMDTRFVVFLF